MFTGIIENIGTITKVEAVGGNQHFTLTCPFVEELKIDQSLAHNGVCLTVVNIEEDKYKVTAIAETLRRTDLKNWKVGDKVNLERCMPVNGRLDGHIVQGHVDAVGICKSITEKEGSWEFVFDYSAKDITVEKGSITVNGVSLTVVNSEENSFSVHLIPYTFKNTVFHQLREGDVVNLEFDIIGKYVARLMGRR